MIQATEIKVLDLKAGDISLGLFQVKSEWEGFKKLESLEGRGCLIVAPTIPKSGMSSCFDGLFAGIKGIEIIENMNVVAASPDLAFIIKSA